MVMMLMAVIATTTVRSVEGRTQSLTATTPTKSPMTPMSSEPSRGSDPIIATASTPMAKQKRPVTIKTVGVLRQVAHHATGETHIGHLGLVLGHKLCYQSVIIVCHIHYVLNNRPFFSFHARDAT